MTADQYILVFDKMQAGIDLAILLCFLAIICVVGALVFDNYEITLDEDDEGKGPPTIQ